ncbi:hypothetical protein BCR32DRAFT_298646, partial [Anaeromyces robustus]
MEMDYEYENLNGGSSSSNTYNTSVTNIEEENPIKTIKLDFQTNVIPPPEVYNLPLNDPR